MSKETTRAELVRGIELAVLIFGMAYALYILSLGAKGAFLSNLRTGLKPEDVIMTAFSLVFMGAVVVAPFLLVALLGKKIAVSGRVTRYQQAGLAISLLLTLSSVYLYADAQYLVSTDRSSTAGLVFLAVPVILCIVGSALYGVLIFLHSRQKPKAP